MSNSSNSDTISATPEGLVKARNKKGNLPKPGNPDKKGWSNQDLADRAGVSIDTVKRFFKGTPIQRNFLEWIVEALALDITEIVDLREWNLPKVDWQNVCYQLLEEQPIRRQATSRHGGHEIKIHVPLGLVKPCRQVKREDGCIPNPTEGMQQYKLSETEIEKQFQQDEFLTQVVNKPGKNIAIIGEPGAGKSTWLSKISEYLMQPENFQAFAICIPLGNLQGMSLEAYLRQFWLKTALPKIDPKAVDVSAALEQELVQLFNSGKVWLLLDGADEMRSPQPPLERGAFSSPPYEGGARGGSNPLQQIANQLTGWIAQARVVLSCRLNVWQANDKSLTNFETYRTLHFENEQVKQFIQDWFAQAEKPELGQDLLTKLAEPEKDRIRDLVKNPLRLSLLCETWDEDQDLPETKALLYQRFRDAFYGWKKDEFPITATQKQGLNQALAQLAFTALERQISLRESLCEEVMNEAAFKLAQEIGWLNFVYRDAQTNEPVYAFFHLTFQEYFAALAVPDWPVFLTHVPNNPKQGIYRIFEPQWKEVILLWLGRVEVPDHQKEELITALVEFEDGCLGFYWFQAFFLAAVCFTEFKNFSRIEPIIINIVEWGFGYIFPLSEFTILVEKAREVLHQTYRPTVICVLTEFISLIKDNDTRRIAAESLGKIDPGNPEAIAVLVELIRTCEDHSTCTSALESLEEIGTDESIRALVDLIHTCEDHSIRRIAAKSLGEIGTDESIRALVDLIRTCEDHSIRRIAAESLGEIGTDESIRALVDLIHTCEDDYTRTSALESLGKVDPGNPETIAILVDLIRTCEDDYTRRIAAESLGKIDPGNPETIAVLVELIRTCENDYTRRTALESLGEIGTDNSIAILIELIGTSQDKEILRCIPYILGKIGTDESIRAVVELIRSCKDKSVRLDAVESLLNIGVGHPEAITALVKLLHTCKDEYTRSHTAWVLGKIDPGNLEAIATLADLIETNKPTRYEAIASLRDIGTDNSIQALVELMRNCEDNNICNSIIDVLGISGGVDHPEAIAALVDLIGNCKDKYIRRNALNTLQTINPNHPEVITDLVNLIRISDDEITLIRAIEQLGKIDPGHPEAITVLAELLCTYEGNYQGIFENDEIQRMMLWSLGNIGIGHPVALAALLEFILTSPNQKTRRRAIGFLTQKMLMKNDQMMWVVSALKGFLSDETYEKDFKRVCDCYEVFWHCAQNLPYPTFYEAWHHPTGTPHPKVDAVACSPALTLSQLPQLLNAALTSLNLPVESVLCIDGSKFENPDNPALEIYAELVLHGFPERQTGESATMQQLKVYCQLKCRNLFLIFYEDPTSPPPQDFSPVFLSSLSKFAQVNRICVVSDQAEIPVQSFSASDPNLISELVAWMGRMGMEELG